MKRITYVLQEKADPSVYSIHPSASVHEAVKLMADKNIGALLVSEGGNFVGLLDERDCVRKLLLNERSPKDTPVREIMRSPVQYVAPTYSNEQCMALMTEMRLRHLPVMDNGRLVGLVSIGDLVKDIISEQNFIISELERYIAGVKG